MSLLFFSVIKFVDEPPKVEEPQVIQAPIQVKEVPEPVVKKDMKKKKKEIVEKKHMFVIPTRTAVDIAGETEEEEEIVEDESPAIGALNTVIPLRQSPPTNYIWHDKEINLDEGSEVKMKQHQHKRDYSTPVRKSVQLPRAKRGMYKLYIDCYI